MKWLKNKDVKNAISIGIISSFAYFVCYIARNVLSVVAPQLVSSSSIDEVFIGTLSTVNMWTYAGGQLINGIIGDKIKAKYLVSLGLVLSGIANACMGLFDSKIVMLIAYGFVGFFLSMIYAPLTKLIAENVRPSYAVNCCLGLTFASLAGVPVAGIVASFFERDMAFVVCGILLMLSGAVFYIGVASLERRGVVSYKERNAKTQKGGSIKVLLENEIVRFSLVAIVDGIVRTSVLFWVPTYLSQYL